MDYNKSIHRIGRISTAIAILLILAVPVVMTIANAWAFQFGPTVASVVQVWMVFIPVSIAEVLSYSPALGPGGTYLAFLSGNISNMKLPAAVSGMNLMGADPGTDEGEVASVLSIGVSTIITMLVLVIGLFALTPLSVVLQNPVLKPGFDNIMPALIGAMLITYIMKSPKLMIAPFIVAMVLAFVIAPASWIPNQGYSLLITIAISVIAGIVMHNKGWLGKKEEEHVDDPAED